MKDVPWDEVPGHVAQKGAVKRYATWLPCAMTEAGLGWVYRAEAADGRIIWGWHKAGDHLLSRFVNQDWEMLLHTAGFNVFART